MMISGVFCDKEIRSWAEKSPWPCMIIEYLQLFELKKADCSSWDTNTSEGSEIITGKGMIVAILFATEPTQMVVSSFK